MEGSGGGRLGASGPGGSTKWDLAVLGDGAARPERHRLRRIAAAELLCGEAGAAALRSAKGGRERGKRRGRRKGRVLFKEGEGGLGRA